MHIATVTEKNPLDLGPGRYVAEDVTAGQMLANGWASRLDCPNFGAPLKPFDASKDWNGKDILFVRPGGFGDLLFLTPTFREIKKRWPDAKIGVLCFDRFHSVLSNNPDVAGTGQYPVRIDVWNIYDAHVWLEGIIEKNPDALKVHAVDLIAQRCGIELTDKRMKYVVTKDELAKAVEKYPAGERVSRIGIQMTASGNCRIYPHTLDVAKKLWQAGHEVFLFGRPGEVQTDEPDGIVNLTQRATTFRESCALVPTCDVFVGPDSALVHVAGAINVPCVALYGPFPWTLRTAYAEKTFAIQGVGSCAPCFHHALPGKTQFPEHGPCSRTGRCEVLASITPERVVREVEKRLEHYGRR